MTQIELRRGADHRAIVVDPANPNAAYAAARVVLDEWESTPVAEPVAPPAPPALAAMETGKMGGERAAPARKRPSQKNRKR